MTRVAVPCPQCGAQVEFRWSGAVQTTCPYCRSILVRRHLNFERVGAVGDLPLELSPIQLGTEGRWGSDTFVVVGRIIYDYARGSWNEWHLAMGDGTSGWLSDAQLEYGLSRELKDADGDALKRASKPGETVDIGGQRFEVTTVTQARYRGVEGELPFEYWDKSEATFVDCRSVSGQFATIDHSESPPLVFVGEIVGYDRLSLENVRQFEGW